MHPTMETYIRMQSSPETQKAYRKDLQVWTGFRNSDANVLLALDADMVLRFKQHLLDSGLAVNSQARVWSTVKGYFRFLVTRGDRPSSPFEYIKGPKRPTNVAPKVPADADIDALVAAAADDPQRSLIIALLLNGLRASEVAGLLKRNVETHEGATFLRLIGKGMKERIIPATIEAQQAMLRYWANCSIDQRESEYVVSEFRGARLSLRQVQHAVYKSAEYAGVEDMHPHALRHHYATRLIRAGASPLHVKDLLGHASVATTQVYVRLDLKDLLDASAKDPRNQQEPSLVDAATGAA